ncbi:MAG: TIM barrel protein [Bryobacteraceae bacterium]
MTRRTFLMTSAAAVAAAAGSAAPRNRMGIATTSYMTVRRFRDTLEFLEHCNALGAAGIQAALSSTDPAYLKKVRARAEELGMYVEVMAPMPKADSTAFEHYVQAAKDVGAVAIRSGCLSGRRYETFATLEDWNKFVAESKASIARAVPIVEKMKVPMGLENHKDWTLDEHLEIMKKYAGDYFGCCLDAGNNISLLDDPMELIERLAPYAVTTHLKDMAVDEAPDGFLLSEMVMGTGMLDMKRVIATIQSARPKTNLLLEMITRDPLRVPCLTDKYWATFPDRKGIYLAKTLRMVKAKKQNLPVISTLDHEAQLKVEADNVKRCLAFA